MIQYQLRYLRTFLLNLVKYQDYELIDSSLACFWLEFVVQTGWLLRIFWDLWKDHSHSGILVFLLQLPDFGDPIIPIIEKISELIRTWTSFTLSYAGRLELLRSVIQGFSCYWLSIFPIPSIVNGRIEGLCRVFLWGSKVGRVAWKQVCLPREKGGLGLLDLRSWNKALLAKTLWNIHTKKDTLGVKWVNEFFLRGWSIWEWVPKKDSPRIFKKLVRIRDEMIAKSVTVQAAIAMLEPWSGLSGLHVKSIYNCLRPCAPPSPALLPQLWHSVCTPKHSFIVWLAMLERLPTKDRMKLGDGNLGCVLCGAANETMDIYSSRKPQITHRLKH